MSPVVSSKLNIILIEKHTIQNPETIIATLQEGQEGLNILGRVVGLENEKGLTDDTITLGRGEEVILAF
jgi:hypothetical protein